MFQVFSQKFYAWRARQLAVHSPIWSNQQFVLLWCSLTIAMLGGQITEMVLPLTAATHLKADARQMGWLIALETLPFALLSLPSGVWIERLPKLPIIKITFAALMATLITIPIAAWGGWLSMTQLYIVGFILGVCMVFMGTALQVLTTQVVGKEHLVDAQGAMSASGAAARTAGPASAGALVQMLSAPIVIVVDVIALGVAWVLLLKMKVIERVQSLSHLSFWRQVHEGLHFIFNDPNLKVLTWAVALWQVLFHAVLTLQILLATNELKLTPQAIGFGFAAGGLTAVLGAAYTSRLTQKYAVGPVMTTGFVLTALGWTALSLTPYVAEIGPWRAIAFAFSQIIFQAGVSLFFVTYLAMRQVLTPVELLSRVTATMRFMTVAAAPVGALLAGYMGDWIGVRQTLWLIAGCSIVLVLSVTIGTNLSKMQNPIFPESKSV